ncbi:NEL-type E3 ubiquitin ligase domain-containing protein [Pseudomonas sp. TWI923]|uniref:NEL-type E3 ubiquitin ligase domain-containing protein n=1 Tax=Pseudomonas sp. TWI923 TaxID=3136794 RepID=UPI0032079C59
MSGTPLPSATDAFIAQQLPAWLRSASVDQLQALRARFQAHRATQDRLAEAWRQIESPIDFARPLFERMLSRGLGIAQPLEILRWEEAFQGFKRGTSPFLPELSMPGGTISRVTLREPALQRLLQNVEQGQAFFPGTGLAQGAALQGEGPDLPLPVALDKLVEQCRSLDVGQRYQEHLQARLDAELRRQIADDGRLGLGVAAQIAAMKQEIDEDVLSLLLKACDGQLITHPDSAFISVQTLDLLDCPVDGALLFVLSDDLAGTEVKGVVCYLPGAPQAVLKRYDSWAHMNAGLGTLVKDPAFQGYLLQRVALGQRARFITTLRTRVQDSSPDMQPRGKVSRLDVFAALAQRQVERILQDACLLVVPTRQVDAAASRRRREELEEVGLTLLNLAAFFVPGVGELLLAKMLQETLTQVYEGVADWSKGRDHEALEHLLNVAQTVVGNTLVAGGAVAARRFVGSAFVDGLKPVTVMPGKERLWSDDLQPYRTAGLPGSATLTERGLYGDGQRHWWRDADDYYEVHQARPGANWSLRHPGNDAAYGPELVSNGERAWRLAHDEPQAWSGSRRMLGVLWPGAQARSPERVAQILKVAGIDEDGLRGLLVENRPLPVTLRDTLERFEVSEAIDAFFTALGRGKESSGPREYFAWCLHQPEIVGLQEVEQRDAILLHARALRGRLLEHFAVHYVHPDALLGLVQRDFPGLPDAYAAAVLREATTAQRQRMTEARRVPLALAEKARELLREAKLTRALEGFYLQDSHCDETCALVLSLLSRQAAWPQSINLEVRQGSDSGRRLGLIFPEGRPGLLTTLVRNEGRYRLYNDGRASEVEVDEPSGWEQVLLAMLAPSDRQRLGWTGDDAPAKVRQTLQQSLPSSRRDIALSAGISPARPWFNPGRRMPDGRVGYPLSGRGDPRQAMESTFRARVRALYPGIEEAELEVWMADYRQSHPAAFSRLLRQEQQYRDLDEHLQAWMSEQAEHRTARQRVAQQISRAWQMCAERLVDVRGTGFGMRLSLVGVPAHSLPDIPAGVSFPHVTELVLVHLELQSLPTRFLQCFPNTRSCNLSNNRLSRLPNGLGLMTRLHELRLNNNRIRLDEQSSAVIQSLGQLRLLDVSDNPLGPVDLPLDELRRLRELHARNCRLQRLPADLLWAGYLELADLRDNQIATLQPIVFQTPYSFRRALLLAGNPLPASAHARLMHPGSAMLEPVNEGAAGTTQEVTVEQARQIWVGSEDGVLRERREQQWDLLAAEPESEALLQLFAELTGTSDYREAREDLGNRLWDMIEAASEQSALREELFNWAGSGRTCADSVIGCFSALEVRVQVAQMLRRADAGQAEGRRLEMARRLFRLEQVQAYARADLPRVERALRRQYPDESVDEVEVDLAYRIGLAERLSLPRQPRTMQFRSMAHVGDEQLADAERSVRAAEANGEVLARFISQRDFWQAYLKQQHATSLDEVQEPFFADLERLDERRIAGEINEGGYLAQADALRQALLEAEQAWYVRLTREALARVAPGER